MKISKAFIVLFFLFLFVIGAFQLTDFGVGWDEEAQIGIGKTTYDFLTKGDMTLFSFWDKNYGVGFELPVYSVQQLFETQANQYYFRHYCVHFLFIIGLIFLFRSVLLIFKENINKQYLGLLTVLFVVLSPRIYADSFFNSKDIVMLSVSCINFFTILKFIEKPSKFNLFLLALSSAYLLDIRIIGLMNVLLIIGVISIKLILEKSSRKEWIHYLVGYIICTSLILYMIWPYLYYHPFDNFWTAFTSMKKYNWTGSVLFNGSGIESTKLPCYYSLVWMGITSPIFYLVLFLVGFIYTLKKLWSQKTIEIIKNNQSFFIFISLALAIGPILAVIILKSVLYDGWRQLFYVYPYIIIIGVYGFSKIQKSSSLLLKYVTYFLLVIQCSSVAFFMIKNHPHSNVYFNEIVSHKKDYLIQNYERDYWGVAYKQALEKIPSLMKSENDTLNVVCQNAPGVFNAAFIPVKYANRIHVYKLDELQDSMKNHMNYFVTNYRGATHLFPKCTNKIWSINIQNSDVVAIYDLRNNENCFD